MNTIETTVAGNGQLTTTIDAREGITEVELLDIPYCDLCTLQEAGFGGDVIGCGELFIGKYFTVLPRSIAKYVANDCEKWQSDSWRVFEARGRHRAKRIEDLEAKAHKLYCLADRAEETAQLELEHASTRLNAARSSRRASCFRRQSTKLYRSASCLRMREQERLEALEGNS